MNEKQYMIPVIVIQGPTGVGKSSIALKLAEDLNTEIISADSRQVYKLLNIGTAKPSEAEQKLVKHHLINIINPDDDYSAGDFAKNAMQAVKNIYSSGKIPIIAGGTGFYIKALLEGIFQAPDVPSDIRENFIEISKEKGSLYLYNQLEQIDPESAVRINENDLNRIIRALEIYEYTGKTITQLWQEKPPEKNKIIPLNILINRNRDELYNRINLRVENMIQKGLVEEFKKLLQIGYSPNCLGFNTVGYKELLAYFLEGADMELCIKLIKQHTRNYAKRQLTWYRRIHFDLTLDITDINFSNVIDEIKKNIT